jgi:aryl-alcohol dehydrogenase-like predicted oxidoreductase
MTFGTPVPAEEAVRIVHWALDHGINFIDTADMYEGYARVMGSAGGVAEEILGQALRDRRSRAVVTTKVGNAVGNGPDDKGLGRKHILHQIDASLRRMRTSYVDYYELHRPDPETPLAESIAVMAELVAAGKVRHWGFSNFPAPQIREMIRLCGANGWPRPAISQPPYSWLKRDVEAEELPACRELGIAVTPYQPLQGGLLSGKYRRGAPPPATSRAAENSRWLSVPDDALFDRLEAFEREAQQRRLEPASYAIRWLLEKPGIASVVVGVKSIEQLSRLIPAD